MIQQALNKGSNEANLNNNSGQATAGDISGNIENKQQK